VLPLPRYLAGAAAARTGDELAGPALLLAGFALTGAAAVGSALLAACTAAAAVGGPLLGVLLDRSPRPGRILAGALAGYAVALLVVVACLGRVPAPVAVAVAVAAGLLAPALSGGWTAQLPRLVAPGGLARATTLDAMTFGIGSLGGPALAAAVAWLAGATASVVAACVLIALAVPVAAALPASSAPGEQSPTSVGTDLAVGWRAISRAGPLARATVTSTVSFVGVGLFTACAPLLGRQVSGAAWYGALILAGVAATALTVNAVLARRPHPLPPDTVVWASALLLGGAHLLAATGSPALLLAAVVLAGVGDGPQLAALFAVRHREASAAVRARVFTTGASVKLTGFAAGAALAGPVASWSLPGALALAAGCELLAVLAYALLTAAARRPAVSPARRWPT
jgi:MFS family permease